MNNIGIFKAWSTLSVQQRIIAIGSTLAVIGCFWALFTVSSKEGQALLFSGLEPAAAGEVIGELDSMAIPYSVKGSAIYVPASQKDRLRLDLAQKGLPATSGVGYEILDNLNGFSTTADMFNAAYWRAKEGELSRTILAMPGVRSARVHLGVTRESAFRRQTSNKTASVTLDAPMGLSEEKARSVQFLTALAVPNLSPDSVAVIDMQRGVLAGPGGAGKGMSDLDVDSRTAELETKLSRLLEAHVGMGNARVTVAMDVERQSFAQTERRVDPNSRQVVSRKVEEERDTEQTLGGGVVTVASNLPDGEAELTPPGEDENPILRTRRNEDILYTGTEVETITEQGPGAIRRLSIAVLLNERMVTAEDGTLTPAPRSQEEVDALEALVLSAAGIDTERGDSLTLRILPFDMPVMEEAATPSFVETYILPQAVHLGQMAFLGIVTLVIALFVVKPLFTSTGTSVATAEIADNTARPMPTDAAGLLAMITEENPDDAAAILDAWFEDEQQPA